MLKKLLSILLSFFLFISLSILTILYSARQIIDGPAINNLFNESLSIADSSLSINNIPDMIFVEEDIKLSEYIDQDKYEKSFTNLMKEYLKYYIGIDSNYLKESSNLKEILYDACSKYEELNNYDIDETIIDDFIDEINKSIDENKPSTNDNIYNIFNIIYSDTILISLIIFSIVCIVLIIILRGQSILVHLSIVLIINSLISGGLSKLITMILGGNDSVDSIIGSSLDKMDSLAIISFIIAISLIVLNIILKKILPKKKETPSISSDVPISNNNLISSNEDESSLENQQKN